MCLFSLCYLSIIKYLVSVVEYEQFDRQSDGALLVSTPMCCTGARAVAVSSRSGLLATAALFVVLPILLLADAAAVLN